MSDYDVFTFQDDYDIKYEKFWEEFEELIKMAREQGKSICWFAQDMTKGGL